MRHNNLLVLIEKVSVLCGRSPYTAYTGRGGNLKLKFRRTEQDDRKLDPGEWIVWIQCAWRLERDRRVLTGSLDDPLSSERTVQVLISVPIARIDIGLPALDSVFRFTDGHSVRAFSSAARDENQWQLFRPNGEILTVAARGEWHDSEDLLSGS